MIIMNDKLLFFYKSWKTLIQKENLNNFIIENRMKLTSSFHLLNSIANIHIILK
jgi:hypothetical protein